MLRPHPDPNPDIPRLDRIVPDSHSQNLEWPRLIGTDLDKSGRKSLKFSVQHAKLTQAGPKSSRRPARLPPAPSGQRLVAAVLNVEAAETRSLNLDVGAGLGEVEALAGDGGEAVLAGALQALDVAGEGPDVVQVLARAADR